MYSYKATANGENRFESERGGTLQEAVMRIISIVTSELVSWHRIDTLQCQIRHFPQAQGQRTLLLLTVSWCLSSCWNRWRLSAMMLSDGRSSQAPHSVTIPFMCTRGLQAYPVTESGITLYTLEYRSTTCPEASLTCPLSKLSTFFTVGSTHSILSIVWTGTGGGQLT